MKNEIELIQYVAIGFYEYDYGTDGKVIWKTKNLIKIIDIPRVLYEQEYTKNRLHWILSRFRYLNYKKYYDTAYQFYCKKTGIDLAWDSAHTKLSSAKGTLTKYNNKIEAYKNEWQPSLMCQNIEQDERYILAMQKVQNKLCEIANLEKALQAEIENPKPIYF
jgi:hypothetical protein